MRYRIFGERTGLRVSELALGTGTFGTQWGYGAEPAEARRMFDGYAEAGGNFLDCADGYQFGQAETLLGDFVAADRDHFIIATKYTLGADPKGDISRTGNSRRNMIRSIEAILRRLKTDRVDLYWVHMPDGVTPMDEILRGLDDLVRAGKILYAGLSDFAAWQVARAATIADLCGWAPMAGLQIEYSLAERTPDRELLPMAQALGLGTVAWSPLGGGFLTGKYRQSGEGRLKDWGNLIHSEGGPRETAIIDALLAVAGEIGAAPGQVAIAWVAHRSLIPILGPRSRAQLDDNLGALEVSLSPEQLGRLDDASIVSLGFPHEMLAKEANVAPDRRGPARSAAAGEQACGLTATKSKPAIRPASWGRPRQGASDDHS
jgi:aryl-alcohol dehydrogenase-like predicted oxidoreductase